MKLLRQVQTRFQEIVLIITFSLLGWTLFGGAVFLLGESDTSFIYFGKWGFQFISEVFNYYGIVYFLLPVFIYTLGTFTVRKTESFMDFLRVRERVALTFAGFFFLSLGLSALTFILTHHYSFQFADKLAANQAGLIGSLIGESLYTLFGFNGALLILVTILTIVAILTTDFKISDLILALEEHGSNLLVWTKNKLIQLGHVIKHFSLKLLTKNSHFNHAVVKAESLQKQIEVIAHEIESVAINSAPTIAEVPALEPAPAVTDSAPAEPKKKKPAPKLRVAVDNTNPNIILDEIKMEKAPAPEESEALKIDEDAEKKPLEIKIEHWKKNYDAPKTNFLSKSSESKHKSSASQQKAQSRQLEECLAGFGLNGKIVAAHCGDRLSMFEFEPDTGVKISKIQSLTNDLALSLGATAIRILAPIPGKSTIGIEIPNESYGTLNLGNLMEAVLKNKKAVLPFAMGKNVYGETVVADLNAMPHLLVSGTTGSGKSVFMNCLITSLLFNNSPKDLRFLMIDPKMIELTPYNGIPHLLKPVICDVDESKDALVWAEHEMDRRYKAFADVGARNIDTYNEKIKTLNKKSLERKIAKKIEDPEHMPYIVIVIDELADLMITQGKEVERPITRIAQKARACGIHLILATQRPSAEIVTGLIKTNFPSRIAFKVASSIDSRTILDSSGAERLLGQGDMLYLPNGKHIERLQGAFVSEEEVCKIVKYISE
jgi:S-DNA-T family DNA segregation ATPase FtsK/SpoIIIE